MGFKVIKSLTATQLLRLMALVFVVPVVAMLWMVAATLQKDIYFAQQELLGDAYQRPLQTILESLTPYAWAKLEGKDPAALSAGVDKGFAELMQTQSKYGAALQVTPTGLASRQREAYAPDKLLARWNDLKSAKDFKTSDLVALANDLKGLLSHTGDTSNLILDPDLDSYYLMDATMCAAVQTQNRLITTQFDTADLITKGNSSLDDKISSAVNSAMFNQSDRSRVAGDLDTVFKEDKNFHGLSPTLQPKLTPALESYAKASVALEDLHTKISKGEEVLKTDYLKAADNFNRESFSFWRQGVDELDLLLQKRISDCRSTQTLAVVIGALLAIAGVTGLAFYLSQTIRKILEGVIQGLTQASQDIGRGAQEIAASSEGLAQASSEQASTVEETSASMEEIASMVKTNGDSIEEVSVHARGTHQSAQEGMAKMKELDKRLELIRQSGELLKDAMAKISSSSKEVGQVANTIDEIAFQTNLLSLNAAVEAARAGEAGAGFAVVANEVRSLAQRSASNAAQTTQLIEQAASSSKEGVEASQQVNKSLDEASRLFAEVTRIFDVIVSQVSEVSGRTNEVRQASSEQAKGVEQVNIAMTQIDQVIQQNAATSQETAGTAAQLTQQAEEVDKKVKELKRLVYGEKTTA